MSPFLLLLNPACTPKAPKKGQNRGFMLLKSSDILSRLYGFYYAI